MINSEFSKLGSLYATDTLYTDRNNHIYIYTKKDDIYYMQVYNTRTHLSSITMLYIVFIYDGNGFVCEHISTQSCSCNHGVLRACYKQCIGYIFLEFLYSVYS